MTNRFLRFGLVSGLLCAALVACAPQAEAFVGGFKVRMTLSLVVDGAPVEIVRTYKCGGAGRLFNDYVGAHRLKYIFHELPNGAAIAVDLLGNNYCYRDRMPSEYSPPISWQWPSLLYLENADIEQAKYLESYEDLYVEGYSFGGHIDMTKSRMRLEEVGRFSATSDNVPQPLYDRLKRIFHYQYKFIPNPDYPFRALRIFAYPQASWRHIEPLNSFLLSLDKPTLLLPSMPAVAPLYAKKQKSGAPAWKAVSEPWILSYGSTGADPKFRNLSETDRPNIFVSSLSYKGDGVWVYDGGRRHVYRYFRIEDGLDKLKPFPIIEFLGERVDTSGVRESFRDNPVIWFYDPAQKYMLLFSQLNREQLYY